MSAVTRALVPISSERALAAAVRAHMSRIHTRAREIAHGNLDLTEDLEQEALIRLWELDPTRFDAANIEDRQFLLRAMINRMREVARLSRHWTSVERQESVSGGNGQQRKPTAVIGEQPRKAGQYSVSGRK